MDLLLVFLVVLAVILFVIKRRQKVQESDLNRIDAEIEKDFKSEFETDSQGSLTEKGMLDLVNWCEENSKNIDSQILQEINNIKK